MYLVEYSSAPMVRNAALADVAFQIVEHSADWVFGKWGGELFARKSKGGVFARIGQTSFNVVIAGTAGTVATNTVTSLGSPREVEWAAW